MPEINKELILNNLAALIDENREEILAANRADIAECPPDDAVILDRLKVDDAKIDAMIRSVKSVATQADQRRNLAQVHF